MLKYSTEYNKKEKDSDYHKPYLLRMIMKLAGKISEK
jgi:hypothetical protein